MLLFRLRPCSIDDMMTYTVVQGACLIDTIVPIGDAAELAGYPALEHFDLENMMARDEARAFLIEMDTKYAQSSAINFPYTREGQAVVRFELDDEIIMDEFDTMPTDVIFTPAQGWTLRVLGGRYDHLAFFARN